MWFVAEAVLVLILPSDAIRLMQEKRMQWDDLIKGAPVKPQTMEDHMEDVMEMRLH